MLLLTILCILEVRFFVSSAHIDYKTDYGCLDLMEIADLYLKAKQGKKNKFVYVIEHLEYYLTTVQANTFPIKYMNPFIFLFFLLILTPSLLVFLNRERERERENPYGSSS